MPGAVRHILLRSVMLLALLAGFAGCAVEDETAMRARLDQWFSLGETVQFAATGECAAGLFRLVDEDIGAGIPVTGNVGAMLVLLPQRGVAALDDPAQSPDQGLVELANAERAVGMAMRRIGLEARACMEGPIEGAFRAALLEPAAVLAYDRTAASVILMNAAAGVLVVARGAG